MALGGGTALVLALAAFACSAPQIGESEVQPPVEEDDTPGPSVKNDTGTADVPPIEIDAGDAAETGGEARRVFVTSVARTARYGGLTAADTICRDLATVGNVGKPGATWIAWLSNKNGPHAVDRLTSDGPWQLPGGEVVAANKAALVAGPLQHAIDHDEKGVAVAPGRVWTGTGADGRYSTNDCDQWTNGNDGRYGLTNATDATWTTSGVDDCDDARHLYCFEL